jgi:hypothetical protein
MSIRHTFRIYHKEFIFLFKIGVSSEKILILPDLSLGPDLSIFDKLLENYLVTQSL